MSARAHALASTSIPNPILIHEIRIHLAGLKGYLTPRSEAREFKVSNVVQ